MLKHVHVRYHFIRELGKRMVIAVHNRVPYDQQAYTVKTSQNFRANSFQRYRNYQGGVNDPCTFLREKNGSEVRGGGGG